MRSSEGGSRTDLFEYTCLPTDLSACLLHTYQWPYHWRMSVRRSRKRVLGSRQTYCDVFHANYWRPHRKRNVNVLQHGKREIVHSTHLFRPTAVTRNRWFTDNETPWPHDSAQIPSRFCKCFTMRWDKWENLNCSFWTTLSQIDWSSAMKGEEK